MSLDRAVAQQRYAGRPLLRLLDCYVLAVTGNLAPDVESRVAEMMRRGFGGGRDWKMTLRQRVNLPDDIEQRIAELWRSQPGGSDPLAFALAVSDENFAPLIDAL